MADRSKKHISKILAILEESYPGASCSLTFRSPHQLLVATILSAQCTDERVNIVTPGLFKKYKTTRDFAEADIKELENDIRSTGFFRNKAKAIKESAMILVREHNGKMPESLEELIKLPGVGRKTASVVLGAAFGKAEGIVVDTHVARISFRLGLTEEKEPLKIERDLMKIIPKKDWIDISHRLIIHGRQICKARRPDCNHCPLNRLCPTAGDYL
jgi:endonuclease-3